LALAQATRFATSFRTPFWSGLGMINEERYAAFDGKFGYSIHAYLAPPASLVRQ